MFLRSSVHVFTNKPKKFADYVLDEYTDEEMAQNALELYIQRIFSIQESFGERPLHRVTERFAKEVFSAFSAPTESETVINELERRGAHFNINGDVLYSKDAVHILDPREFGCSGQKKGMMYHTVKSVSGTFRRNVVSLSVAEFKDGSSECRIYIGERGKVCGINRSSEVSENEEWDMHNLPEMFSRETIEELNTILNPLEYVRAFSSAFGLVTEGEGYEEFLKNKCKFIKSDRLHNIYEIIDNC